MTYTRYCVPVSVKGLVFDEGKVWLRKNERLEWELPGGKLDEGEQPAHTAIRELQEELGFTVTVERLLQAHMYIIGGSIDESKGVLVITYLCNIIEKGGPFELIGEAGSAEFDAFSLEDALELNMPSFYKDAIAEASKIVAKNQSGHE